MSHGSSLALWDTYRTLTSSTNLPNLLFTKHTHTFSLTVTPTFLHLSSLFPASHPLPSSSHFHLFFSSPQSPERMIAKSPLAVSRAIGNSFRSVSITFLSSSGIASDNMFSYSTQFCKGHTAYSISLATLDHSFSKNWFTINHNHFLSNQVP